MRFSLPAGDSREEIGAVHKKVIEIIYIIQNLFFWQGEVLPC
jgi:hypothetical protein